MARSYDIIIIGAGLGGSALATVMARAGMRILLLEREQYFRDRVRGEGLFPWGVAELEKLGLLDGLVSTCATGLPQLDVYLEGSCIDHRDLSATSSHLMLNWVHSEMEEVLLQSAAASGAEVRRAAHACDVHPGSSPAVVFDYEGRLEEATARLVVCADGQGSLGRKWGGFPVVRANYGMLLAGVLLKGVNGVASNTNSWFMSPSAGQFAFLCPLRDGSVRAYVWHPREWDYRYQGENDWPRFFKDSTAAGVPQAWYADARCAGPLATFDGTDTWVEHPYKNGIALIGDAAASSDPSYGQGQALTVRDVRVLRDQLLASDDWNEAGHNYAAEHDHYYSAVHEFTGWIYSLFYENGPTADQRRARALPLIGQDMTRMPDVIVGGPDRPLDESVRRRFFGED